MKPDYYMFCPICHAKQAVQVYEPEYHTYRNKTKLLWFKYFLCYNCKSDYSGDEELKYNHGLIVDFKQEVDATINKANQT